MREKWYDCVVSPVVTEKSTMVQEHNQVVFLVAMAASKPEIKAAVEGLFQVKVDAVNTSVRKGKKVRFRGIAGRHKHTKRAFVTLASGHSIDPTSFRV